MMTRVGLGGKKRPYQHRVRSCQRNRFVETELFRQKAEAGRVSAEEDRTREAAFQEQAEENWLVAEQIRISAEQEWQEPEHNRDNAERGRKLAENRRIYSEEKRQER